GTGPRRPAAVRRAVVVLEQASAPRPGQRRVPDGLRRAEVFGGIHSRARCLPGLAGRRPVDGAASFAAHDRRRRGHFSLECKKIDPFIVTVTVSVPGSRGTRADSSADAAMAIMRGAGWNGMPMPPRLTLLIE